MWQGRTWNHVMVCAACNHVSVKTPVEESDDIVVKDLDGNRYEGAEDCYDSDASIHVDA